jgi:hypothetical protein
MADDKIEEGELAVRLNSDINGGLGRHKKGTVLRHLSSSAFIGLTQGGGHETLKAGASGKGVEDAVDGANVTSSATSTVTKAPTGSK